jgi:hypothetical protein
MTDEQLHSMSVAELRARFNSAPLYLQTLLQRKRVMEEGVVWEIDLQARARPAPASVPDGDTRESGGC